MNRRSSLHLPLALALLASLSACAPGAGEGALPGDSDVADAVEEPNQDFGLQAEASTPSLPSMTALRPAVTAADAVFVGRVLSTESRMSTPDLHGRSLPFTFVTWEVEEGLKGVVAGQRFTSRIIGGEMPDGRVMTVSNVPTFAVGDRDLILLNDNDEEGCPLVDGERGRIRLSSEGGIAFPGLQPVEVKEPTLRSRWAADTLSALRAEGQGQGQGRLARSKDPLQPFAFTTPGAE